jgi:hypothetical protein
MSDNFNIKKREEEAGTVHQCTSSGEGEKNSK